MALAMPTIGFIGELTALIMPHPFVALRLSFLALSKETKLCVAPVSSIVLTALLLIKAFTNMSPFLVDVDGTLLLLSALNCLRDPMLYSC